MKLYEAPLHREADICVNSCGKTNYFFYRLVQDSRILLSGVRVLGRPVFICISTFQKNAGQICVHLILGKSWAQIRRLRIQAGLEQY